MNVHSLYRGEISHTGATEAAADGARRGRPSQVRMYAPVRRVELMTEVGFARSDVLSSGYLFFGTVIPACVAPEPAQRDAEVQVITRAELVDRAVRASSTASSRTAFGDVDGQVLTLASPRCIVVGIME